MQKKNLFRLGVGLAVFALLTTVLAAAVIVSVTVTDAEASFGLANPFYPDAAGVASAEEGVAIVEVIAEPEICDGSTLRFSGVPAGELTLDGCQPGEPVPVRKLSSAALPPGNAQSTLTYIDPAITDLGYELSEIRCDDGPSQLGSTGDIQAKKAIFGIEAGETVTCKFILRLGSPCVCPKEGRWNVKNNTGLMACTGSFNLSRPLKADTTSGTIEVRDNCETLYAEGMTDGEAPITYRRTPQCTYKGSVGQEQFGVPLTIHFTLEVENDERMTGALTSTMSQQGTTCNLDRTYEMNFAGQ